MLKTGVGLQVWYEKIIHLTFLVTWIAWPILSMVTNRIILWKNFFSYQIFVSSLLKIFHGFFKFILEWFISWSSFFQDLSSSCRVRWSSSSSSTIFWNRADSVQHLVLHLVSVRAFYLFCLVSCRVSPEFIFSFSALGTSISSSVFDLSLLDLIN